MDKKYYLGKANFWDFCICTLLMSGAMVTGKYLINLVVNRKNNNEKKNSTEKK